METESLFYELCKIRNLVESPLMKERISYQAWSLNNNGIISPKNEMGKYALPVTIILEDLEQVEQTESREVARLSRNLRQEILTEGVEGYSIEQLRSHEITVQEKHFYPGKKEEQLKRGSRKI